jgi:hypothetical protein
MWRRQVPRYPAHLYLALHVHAAWFGAMTLFTVLAGFLPLTALTIIGVVFFAYMMWYAVLTVRRVFRDSWPVTLMKSAIVGAGYYACLSIIGLALLAYAIMQM